MATSTTKDTRSAVLKALALAGVTPGVTDPTDTAAMLPSARSYRGVDTLAAHDNIEALRAAQPDMAAVCKAVFDWDVPRATKPLVKAAGRALLATDDDGRSRYASGVEALSFVATCVPLLEPDRLARLLDHCVGTPSAYAPLRWPARSAASLIRLLEHYAQQRREALLKSLWTQAHDGRWWDHTHQMGKHGGPTLRRRRRRHRDADDAVEARSAALVAGVTGDGGVLVGLLAGAGVYTPANAEQLRRVEPDTVQRKVLAQLAGGSDNDPDTAVLISNVSGLGPGQLPANPITTMIDTLEFVLGDTAPSEFMPKAPAEFSDLYPQASLARYPIPTEVAALDMVAVPGLDPPAVIELIDSPHALFANRDYMGNCTGGYDNRCRTGETVLGKIHRDGQIYNFSLCGPRNWRLGEINSRFNAGAVPDDLRLALTTLVGTLARTHDA